ncbi:hypothetical protein A9K55_007909 [Cordyceps militaris]|uniref:Efflux pump antibiotic resistance protein n=1 Tax=Cordyceps militaris TaxID=73501 RepID=A0A2H4SFR8_CORMI|nr:hypothetical protein A9K55_007909 [Cordyceps militaris]
MEKSVATSGPPKNFASGHGILCAGLPRSGTASLSKALEILGIAPVHHVMKLDDWPQLYAWGRAAWCHFPYLRKRRLFRAFYLSRYDPLLPWSRGDWDRLIGPYRAVTDVAAYFGPEIYRAYPEARVILVERPFDRWAQSYRVFTDAWLFGFWDLVCFRLAAWVGLPFVVGISDVYTGWMGARTGAQARRRLRELHTAHYAKMRATVPPEKLLDFRLEQGWAPLCAFLDVPVPDVPFPHINERSEVLEFRNGTIEAVLTCLAIRLGVIALGTAALLGAVKGASAFGVFTVLGGYKDVFSHYLLE